VSNQDIHNVFDFLNEDGLRRRKEQELLGTTVNSPKSALNIVS
jgi:hypothetical protein